MEKEIKEFADKEVELEATEPINEKEDWESSFGYDEARDNEQI